MEIYLSIYLLQSHKVRCSKRDYPHGQGAVTVVDWLAQQTVSGQPGRGCELERQRLLSSLLLLSLNQLQDLSSHSDMSEITSCCRSDQDVQTL